MNFALIQVAFDSDLDPRERIVLLALANHCQKDGTTCYPSVPRLKEKTGYKDRSVQGALIALEEQGYITVKKNEGPNGKNLYILHGDPRKVCGGADSAEAQSLRETPADSAQNPRKSCGGNIKKYKEGQRGRANASPKPGASASDDAPPAPRELPDMAARQRLISEMTGKATAHLTSHRKPGAGPRPSDPAPETTDHPEKETTE
ncbi:helix-turn-helix domain-containing protein [Paracoccus ravus]|uniref:helix-turn-helix domain-containing protein n=1 Tax=Paracoccus ravus TaxID=2447760 RepID=UPI00106DD7AF|nr:helix-turn-helix domain-containing protein [Paracoccus ravus]